MKGIINFSMNNKFAIWLMTIIIAAAGLYSGLNMKLETIPNIEPPIITVQTTYPGATPAEVANEVSEPLEKQVSNLSGLKTVSSTSYQNASALQLEYSFDKSLDEAEDELKDAVTKVELPDGAQDPQVSRLNFNAFPVISFSAVSDDKSLAELTETVEDKIVPEIEGLDGVAEVQVSGQQVKEVQMDYKEDKLEELGMDEETVNNLIKGSDVRFPLGLFTFKDNQKSVVLNGNVASVEDFKNLEIPAVPSGQSGQAGQGQAAQSPQAGAGSSQGPTASQGQGMAGQSAGQTPQQGAGSAAGQQAQAAIPTVQLKDIADIKVVGESESISRTNGKDSISIQVVKSQEANTVDVVNEVKDSTEDLKTDLDGMDFIYSFDQGEPIENSVSTMLNKALFGGLFAVLVILLFLRNFKTTIISVISIPLSLLIAVLLLKQMDITLNIMTLGAMTVAIGRVVDDSIVVVENIYRRMSLTGEELRGKELVRAATREMFMPILSSTIVTIAVFLPLGLVEGTVGELFLPFALTVVFALLASLLVAVTIVPMLAHSLLKQSKIKGEKHENRGRMVLGYRSLLNSVLNHKIISSIVAIAILAGSIALLPLVGTSFLADQEQKMVVATYNPEPGQTEDDVEQVAVKAQDFFEGRDGAETVQYSVGGENPMNPGASNQAVFYVEYNDDTENFSDETQKVIEGLNKETSKGEWGSQDFSSSGSSSDLELLVYGDNTDDIRPVIKDVEDMLSKQDNLRNIDSSLSESYDEYTLVPDQEKLSELGLTASQVGMELNQNRQRPVVTKIDDNGETLNVYVDEDAEEYNSIDDLTGKELQTPTGKTVAVSDVVEVKEGTTEDTITRKDGRVYASVSAEITSDDVGSVSQAVNEKLDEIDHPSNIDISMGGVTEDIQESFTQLGLAMLAAIAIVYLVLVIFFGGGLAPLAILFALPFTIIGAVLGLLISGETLSISAMIGALMLIGIVVTNAIVLIDRVINKEKEGFTTREALLDAGMTRMRPILMTALATIGALLPLALGFEGGSIISKGLGVTVIGGLASSTLLTLLIVPLVYEILSKFRRKKRTE
ncbi:efflux RND transporter permease subunit [Halobacillus salinarum]|uniref:Efflux RND transporter permease subunit n=1 Tax=Halobacillus salinarum TaxID=2932257 RepID=A0ABY4EMC2_9BACI|nr:efflux RND transporter permease subunit [Halobacillus salinarum]UOQ45226.1 efflux RND transporter permease subunit [Halobacillus salinarum]